MSLRREAGRQDLSIPVAGEDAPVVTRQLFDEAPPGGHACDGPSPLKPGGDAKDRDAGVVPEASRRKGDRRQVQLQVARGRLMITSRMRPSRTAASFTFPHRTVGALARRRRFLSRCPSAKITCQLGRGGLSASPFRPWPAQV
jgi:hypothetical protein